MNCTQRRLVGLCKATGKWFGARPSRFFTYSACSFVTLAAGSFHSFDRKVSHVKSVAAHAVDQHVSFVLSILPNPYPIAAGVVSLITHDALKPVIDPAPFAGLR